jgi:hypothetical protein
MQATHPSWFEWITVAAIVLGPILALFAQRALDWIREKKKQRLHIYFTLMSTRATPLNVDHVRALNSIDTVFSRRSDKDVREAWTKLLAHVGTDINAPGWQETTLDLRVDLYQAVGKAVGYEHTVDYIKKRLYQPSHHVDIELEQEQIRKGLAKALTNEGLKVIVSESRPEAPKPALRPYGDTARAIPIPPVSHDKD